MKKSLIFIFFFSSFITCEAKNIEQKNTKTRYFGIEAMYGNGSQQTKIEHGSFFNDKITYNEIAFKIGFETKSQNRFELSIAQNKNFAINESSKSTDFSKGSSIDIAYLFMLDFFNQASADIAPFIKIGTGVGIFSIKDEYKSNYGSESIYSVESKIGVGLFSKLTQKTDYFILYNKTNREFQTIKNYDLRVIEISHDIDCLSAGINYYF